MNFLPNLKLQLDNQWILLVLYVAIFLIFVLLVPPGLVSRTAKAGQVIMRESNNHLGFGVFLAVIWTWRYLTGRLGGASIDTL